MSGSHASLAGAVVEEKGFMLSPLVKALDSNTLALALSYLGTKDAISLEIDDSRQYVSTQQSWEAKIELYYPGEEKELKVAECKARLKEDFSKLSPEHQELFRAVIEEDREFLLKLKAPLNITSREVTELKGPHNKTLLQRTKNIRDPEIKKHVLGCIFAPNNLSLSWAIRCQQPLTEIQKLITRGGFNFEDAIIAAIEEENNEVLEKILESADKIYPVNFALKLAVERGRVQALRFLLEQDFKHFPRDLNQPTLLRTAVCNKDSATIVLLLEKEAKQWDSLLGGDKEYALEVIASSGNLPLLKQTLPEDYKNVNKLYQCAARGGHSKVANFLITRGGLKGLPPGMIQELLNLKYTYIKRALITPEQEQQRSQIIAQLIKGGYPLPARSSPINDAATKGESEIVLALLEKAPKLIGGYEDYDNCLLLDAIANGHIALAGNLLQFIVEELLNKESAVLNEELKQKIFSQGNCIYDGKTVCEIAAEKGYPLIDKIIILYKRIHRIQGPLTETALGHLGQRMLHYAAYNGHLAMVQKLLKEFPNNPSFLNANSNPDKYCKLSAGTPLGLAVENEQWTVVAFLLEQENIDVVEAYAAWPKLYKGAKNLALGVLKIKPQLTPAFTEEDYALIADLLKAKYINSDNVNLPKELERAIEALNEEAALIFIAEGAASLDKLIHLAVKLGLTQVVAAILQKEPLVTSIERHDTLLLVAARYGRIDVVNLLVGFPELARKIDIALVLAIEYSHWNVAECLLKNPAINKETSWESFVTVLDHDVESTLQICRANPGFLTKATEKDFGVVERLLVKPELNDIAEVQTAFEVLLGRASENERVLRICRANPGFLTIAAQGNLDRVERLLVKPELNDIAEAQAAFKVLLSRAGENERVFRICVANPGFLTIVTQENPDMVERFLVKPELNGIAEAQTAFEVLLSRADENARVLRICRDNPRFLTISPEKNLDMVERLLLNPELNDIAEAQTAFEVLLSRADENARVLRICRANPGFLTIAAQENLDRVERLLVIPGLNDIAEAQTAFKALLSREGVNERVLRICRANPGFLTIVTQENPDRVEHFLVKPELNNTVEAQEAFKVLLSRAGENASKIVLRIAEANPDLLDKISLSDYPETIEYFLDHSNSLEVLAKIPEQKLPIRLDQRKKIRAVLFAKVDAAGENKAAAINLLEGWRNNSLFAKHRKPCWRGGFARTNSQCLIDEKIKGLR